MKRMWSGEQRSALRPKVKRRSFRPYRQPLGSWHCAAKALAASIAAQALWRDHAMHAPLRSSRRDQVDGVSRSIVAELLLGKHKSQVKLTEACHTTLQQGVKCTCKRYCVRCTCDVCLASPSRGLFAKKKMNIVLHHGRFEVTGPKSVMPCKLGIASCTSCRAASKRRKRSNPGDLVALRSAAAVTASAPDYGSTLAALGSAATLPSTASGAAAAASSSSSSSSFSPASSSRTRTASAAGAETRAVEPGRIAGSAAMFGQAAATSAQRGAQQQYVARMQQQQQQQQQEQQRGYDVSARNCGIGAAAPPEHRRAGPSSSASMAMLRMHKMQQWQAQVRFERERLDAMQRRMIYAAPLPPPPSMPPAPWYGFGGTASALPSSLPPSSSSPFFVESRAPPPPRREESIALTRERASALWAPLAQMRTLAQKFRDAGYSEVLVSQFEEEIASIRILLLRQGSVPPELLASLR